MDKVQTRASFNERGVASGRKNAISSLSCWLFLRAQVFPGNFTLTSERSNKLLTEKLASLGELLTPAQYSISPKLKEVMRGWVALLKSIP